MATAKRSEEDLIAKLRTLSPERLAEVEASIGRCAHARIGAGSGAGASAWARTLPWARSVWINV